MRKIILSVSIIVFCLAIYSCKKSNSSGSNTPESSRWTFKDTSYAGLTTIYNSALVSANGSNSIAVIFTGKPAVSGVYVVSNTGPTSSTNCAILVTNYANQYYSTGKSGDLVNVTVSSSGKVTAIFSGVSIENFTSADIQTVSGTIIEQ